MEGAILGILALLVVVGIVGAVLSAFIDVSEKRHYILEVPK